MKNKIKEKGCFTFLFICLLISCKEHRTKQLLVKSLIAQSKVDSTKDTLVISSELNSAYFNIGDLKIKDIAQDTTNAKVVDKRNYSIQVKRFVYNFDIASTSYIGFEGGKISLPRDFIVLGNSKFFYDNIFYGENSNSKSNPIRSSITKIYEVKTKTRRSYIAVFLKNLFYNNSYSDELVFLFELSNKNKIASTLCLKYTKFICKKFFGDYNENGELEFLSFLNSGDTVISKEIINGKTIINLEKYIVTTSPDGMDETFIINNEKSKWWPNSATMAADR